VSVYLLPHKRASIYLGLEVFHFNSEKRWTVYTLDGAGESNPGPRIEPELYLLAVDASFHTPLECFTY